MTNHQKTLSAPASWPIERKTTVFTVKARPGPHGEKGVPLLVILRNVLEYVNSTREAKYVLQNRLVLLNGAVANDVRIPVGMFDILAFPTRDEYYRIFPESGGRLSLTPITSDSANSKLGKITGKSQLSPDEYQLALHNGTTLRIPANTDYHPGDSLIIDNETGDIAAHFVYEVGALVTVIGGSHSGKIGTLTNIRVTSGGAPNVVQIKSESLTFETTEPYVVVIDDKFTGGRN
tara:strand:+ start:641 stop:1342 length:702 start_codon:yes stop_codon:yes gene_type:complete